MMIRNLSDSKGITSKNNSNVKSIKLARISGLSSRERIQTEEMESRWSKNSQRSDLLSSPTAVGTAPGL
jgi:hypothetical protein